MRISDWSSDVCSSDLPPPGRAGKALRLAWRGRGRADRHPDAGQGPRPAEPDAGVRGGDRRRPVLGRLPRRGEARAVADPGVRSEEHTSELQSLMRISYAVFCLKKKNSISTTQGRQTLPNLPHT